MKKDWMIIESELDDDQINVLKATNDKSCIVSGCAGSGKSVLALIKAQRIQREKGDSYQIIVFTRALCNYMNAGREELKLSNQFDYHWPWKNRKGCPSSDYVIVDEIQDFSKEEIQEFIDATNKHFFFFGDTAQSIYEGLKNTLPVEEINYMLPSGRKVKSFGLYRNYRLPKPVARVIQYVGVNLDGFDLDTYKSKETAMPRFVYYDSFDKQIEAIAKMIKSGGTISDVGILTPHNAGVKRLSEMLNNERINHEAKFDVYRDEYGNDVYERESNGKPNKWLRTNDNLDFTTENPKIMTYHSAKGLQFGTVFLPGVELLSVTVLKRHWNNPGVFLEENDLSKDEKRKVSELKAFYVAMTRTYRNLYVMFSGNLPFPLSEVPKELYKTTEKDVVEDI